MKGYGSHMSRVNKRKIQFEISRPGTFTGGLEYVAAELPDGFKVEMGLERNEDGVLRCVEFKMILKEDAKHPSKHINSRYFQTIGFGELLAAAREKYVSVWELALEVKIQDKVDSLLDEWASNGPNVIADEYYAAIAYEYENYVIQGLENPITQLAETLRENKATISSRVVEARNRGLLTKPKYGSFGGRLTAKGKKALGMEEVDSAKKST
jgi:hypothetical protein